MEYSLLNLVSIPSMAGYTDVLAARWPRTSKILATTFDHTWPYDYMMYVLGDRTGVAFNQISIYDTFMKSESISFLFTPNSGEPITHTMG